MARKRKEIFLKTASQKRAVSFEFAEWAVRYLSEGNRFKLLEYSETVFAQGENALWLVHKVNFKYKGSFELFTIFLEDKGYSYTGPYQNSDFIPVQFLEWLVAAEFYQMEVYDLGSSKNKWYLNGVVSEIPEKYIWETFLAYKDMLEKYPVLSLSFTFNTFKYYIKCYLNREFKLS